MATEKDSTSLSNEIRSLAVPDHKKVAAVALLNLIPFAGGAVASVVGEYASNRRAEKICDVLSSLNATLEKHQADPEKHLTKDQIVEVVYETLEGVVIASDENKIAALTNGLSYAFVEDDSFERKQLFLQVLRSCSTLELTGLRIIYRGHDPYIVRKNIWDYEETERDPFRITGLSVAASPVESMLITGQWRPIGNTESCGQPELMTYIAAQLRVDEATALATCQLLDGKGLCMVMLNRYRKDCTIMIMENHPVVRAARSPNILGQSNNPKRSPIEESRTSFGEGFMRFCCT